MCVFYLRAVHPWTTHHMPPRLHGNMCRAVVMWGICCKSFFVPPGCIRVLFHGAERPAWSQTQLNLTQYPVISSHSIPSTYWSGFSLISVNLPLHNHRCPHFLCFLFSSHIQLVLFLSHQPVWSGKLGFQGLEKNPKGSVYAFAQRSNRFILELHVQTNLRKDYKRWLRGMKTVIKDTSSGQYCSNKVKHSTCVTQYGRVPLHDELWAICFSPYMIVESFQGFLLVLAASGHTFSDISLGDWWRICPDPPEVWNIGRNEMPRFKIAIFRRLPP